jgi:hypothetical protein
MLPVSPTIQSPQQTLIQFASLKLAPKNVKSLLKTTQGLSTFNIN